MLYRKLAGFGQGKRDLHRLSSNPIRGQMNRLWVPLVNRAIAIWQTFVLENPTEPGFQFDLAGFHDLRHAWWQEDGEYMKAFSSLSEARDIYENLAHENPKVRKYRESLAGTYDDLVVCLARAGRAEEIEKNYRQSLNLRKEPAE
jgi:tetratricopeptide (TPR) repeat protein